MKHKIYKNIYFLLCLSICAFTWTSCKKMIEIDPPTTSITTAEVFKDSTNASAAILNLYTQMVNTGGRISYYDGSLTIYCGESGDELQAFSPSSDENNLYINQLQAANSVVYGNFFSPAYQEIYRVNACIDGVNASSGINAANKVQFTGEAKFIRALSYFYLINLFGDVPYITSIDFHQTTVASRTAKAQIYQAIIADLKDAQNLPKDYSISGGEKVRVNYWAATALLAKVYLYYQGDYKDAYASANEVIGNNSLFTLNSDLNSVFLKNSSEAIFQLKLNSNNNGNITAEGYRLIPSRSNIYPNFYLTAQILTAFEPGDKRKSSWIDSTNYLGTAYYYPYKYKLGPANYNAPQTEYYMMLRLAEQYLIRAEAQANGAGNGLSGAIADLNTIRNRAGLPNYAGASDKASVINAIMHERQIELFAEWGNRWMDLKRTGQIDSVMKQVVPTKTGGTIWNNYQQLYPIPQAEITLDPNLTQNPGY